ncbi:flagellar basal body P-ring protein FlgI [Rheinheimera faecalis]|uniref:flagellar basal body P-ring protein FlgI n=1 Tax=Rheinheimera faecalis TaxID=2901141 RepID=UPI001E404838|nr:flagellar basal body P-ring protein FlgI [Rheinheimera faecalis]
MTVKGIYGLAAVLLLGICSVAAAQGSVKIKDLARFDGVRSQSLVGYGLVVGLSGSGDSARSKATIQSIRNTLQNFGVVVADNDIYSRNVAAVIVTTELSAFAQSGDKIDVQVSSLGDARSLTGGTLLLAPLNAINGEIYALAQGSVSVGGYQLEKFDNLMQKNHPTAGVVPSGGTVERSLNNDFVSKDGNIYLILDSQDFSTANNVATTLANEFSDIQVEAVHASRIRITPNTNRSVVSLMAAIENVRVEPERSAKVIINEKTGVIVSGADVMVDNVMISYGSLKLTITTDYLVSQPEAVLVRAPDSIGTRVVPDTELAANEDNNVVYVNEQGTNVAELVSSLQQLNLTTRDIISILQTIKKGGGLHAELIIQ